MMGGKPTLSLIPELGETTHSAYEIIAPFLLDSLTDGFPFLGPLLVPPQFQTPSSWEAHIGKIKVSIART